MEPEPVAAPLAPAEAPVTDPVIVARGVRRLFGQEVALDSLSLEVARGTIYGFVGPSGSGKTTAVRLLIGNDVPTEGEVEVLGRRSGDFDRGLRARLGYMPQESVQFPNLSARENLSFVASLYGMPLRRRTILADALKRTELYPHRKKPVRNLSGGMRRRLALSAALMHDPEVLFLDEPTAGIDPVLRRKLWDQFEVLRDEGRTLFVTTQYVSEAAYCDRVGVLAHGRLIAEGAPEELRRRALGGEVLELTATRAFDAGMAARLEDLEGVRDVRRMQDHRTVQLVADAAEQRLGDVQRWCDDNGVTVTSLRVEMPPFDDVFVALLQQAGAADTTGEFER